MLWITFAPIASSSAIYYNVGDFAINSLSTVFMFVFLPGAPVAAYGAVCNNTTKNNKKITTIMIHMIGHDVYYQVTIIVITMPISIIK